LMIGDGTNRKSMAYVENVAGFLRFSLGFGAGTHIHNYVDKPDYDMNALVRATKTQLGKSPGVGLRVPTWIGLLLGRVLDGIAAVARRPMPLSHVRVQKFVSSSVFSSAKMRASGYEPVVPLPEAVSRTIAHEFDPKSGAGQNG
jgi:nucleoside-diphosphate-sugar epimerase